MSLTLKQLLSKQPDEIKLRARSLRIKGFRLAKTKSGHPGVSAQVESSNFGVSNQTNYSCQVTVNSNEKPEKTKLNKSYVKVSCNCRYFQYYCEYALYKHGASNLRYSNGQKADETNPTNYPLLCIEASQLVQTKQGLVPISDIKIGTLVLTDQGYHAVTNVMQTGQQVPVYLVQAKDKNQHFSLLCTNTHPLCVVKRDMFKFKRKLQWQTLQSIKPNDRVLVYSPKPSGIRKNVKPLSAARIEFIYYYGLADVYDLTVKCRENFIVNGFLVHNCKHLYALGTAITQKPIWLTRTGTLMKGTRPESNLTGGQIQQILDKLLYDSIGLIIPFGILDKQLTIILSSLVLDRRRKISSADYELSIDLLCRLALKTEDDPFALIKQLKLERTLYIKLLMGLVHKIETENYPSLYCQWLKSRSPALDRKLLRIEQRIKIDRKHLYPVYQSIKFNMLEFQKFKSSILSQFINLAHKYTSTQIKHKNKNLNYDDLFQNIVAAISKAIDKYDSSKGALTSYIKYWIINAQNQNNSHIEGQAYEITYNQRQKVARKETTELNFSSSLTASNKAIEETTPEAIVSQLDADSRILALIKRADPKGVFRLAFNIDEFITNEEQALMRQHLKRNLQV